MQKSVVTKVEEAAFFFPWRQYPSNIEIKLKSTKSDFYATQVVLQIFIFLLILKTIKISRNFC